MILEQHESKASRLANFMNGILLPSALRNWGHVTIHVGCFYTSSSRRSQAADLSVHSSKLESIIARTVASSIVMYEDDHLIAFNMIQKLS